MNIPKRKVLRRYGYVFVVLIALMGCVPVAFAQDWMPDANLRVAVREDLGLAADAELTQAKMADLINLHESKAGITNITGIEHATNLQTFVLWGNSFSDLSPLTNLTALTEIRIGDCDNIADVTPLMNLTALTKLGLQGNNISDVSALSGLVNLTWLRLGRNPVTDFSPLSGLKANITNVDITIPDPDTTQPTVSITVPSGAQNGAFDTTITFSEAVSNFVQGDVSLSGTATASITDWKTTDNTVYTATITPTTSGTVILDIAADVATDAANNGNTAATAQTVTINLSVLVAIPDANLAAAVRSQLGLADDASITSQVILSLTTLSATNSGISNLSGLEYATSLTRLNLVGNSISDLSPLEELTSLTWLSLRLNSISDLSPLEDLISLTWLSLGLNSISDLSPLEELTNLTWLVLDGNSISDLSPLEGLTSLTQLSLRSNSISDISPLEELTSLRWLSLGLNSISDLSPLEELTSLTWLYLRSNSISDISPLEELTSLTWLDLDGNSISDLSPLEGLTSLTWLYLKSNSISDISPLEELTSLTQLWLNDNPILDTSPLYPLLVANGGVLLPIDIDVSQYPPWDVDEDGNVDATDSALVTAALGQTGGSIINPRTDVNGDGTVDADDLTLVTDNLDTDGGAPSSSGLLTLLDPATLEKLDPATLDAQLEILRVKSDGSLKYLRAIALLESVLAAMTPEMTQLLANYPNPFNPETWIPYHLAKSSDVRITIYDLRGSVVRRLELGHLPPGYYTSRNRAAYWDGRNAVGERVASGIYFYQLEADNMSLLRKMLILK